MNRYARAFRFGLSRSVSIRYTKQAQEAFPNVHAAIEREII